LPACQAERFGPIRRGHLIFFGSNNESPTSSSQNLPYHGLAFRVTDVVGRCGSGVRTNKNKRKIDDTGAIPKQAAASVESRASNLAQKLEDKPADETCRILSSALKKAKRKANAVGSEVRSGNHVSTNAADRAESSAKGSHERKVTSKEKRWLKKQKTKGKPGQQKQQQKHKKGLNKTLKGIPSGRRKQGSQAVAVSSASPSAVGGGGDITLDCRDCSCKFLFTVGEQEFFEQKGFDGTPVRCKPCREAKKGGQDGGKGGKGGKAKGRGKGKDKSSQGSTVHILGTTR